MNLPRIKLHIATHHHHEVVQLHFAKNDFILSKLRVHKQLRWSQTMCCWYLPYTSTIKSDIFLLVKDCAFVDYSALTILNHESALIHQQVSTHLSNKMSIPKNMDSEIIVHKISAIKNWMQSKRYAESTIDSYGDALKTFLRFYAHKEISDITNDDIVRFNNDYILKNKLSASFQNQIVNAIKLFLEPSN